MRAFPSAPSLMCLLRRTMPLLLVATLLASCASGPSYGAARKKKKSCDCPHWNAVDRPGRTTPKSAMRRTTARVEVHARVNE